MKKIILVVVGVAAGLAVAVWMSMGSATTENDDPTVAAKPQPVAPATSASAAATPRSGTRVPRATAPPPVRRQGDAAQLADPAQRADEPDEWYESRKKVTRVLLNLADDAGLDEEQRARMWRILADGQVNYARIQGDCLANETEDTVGCMNDALDTETTEVVARIARELPGAERVFVAPMVTTLLMGGGVGVFEGVTFKTLQAPEVPGF